MKRKENIHIGPSGRVFKERNAQPTCRKKFVNHRGETVILTGRKGFKWSVNEILSQGRVRQTTFENSKLAKAYFQLVTKNLKNTRFD